MLHNRSKTSKSNLLLSNSTLPTPGVLSCLSSCLAAVWGASLASSTPAWGSSGQPQFVEVVLAGVAEQKRGEPEGTALELIIGHRRVVVRPGFDAQSLREVLAVLEEE